LIALLQIVLTSLMTVELAPLILSVDGVVEVEFAMMVMPQLLLLSLVPLGNMVLVIVAQLALMEEVVFAESVIVKLVELDRLVNITLGVMDCHISWLISLL